MATTTFRPSAIRPLPHEPSHLVVFDKPGVEGTTAALARGLGVSMQSVMQRAGDRDVQLLPSPGEGIPMPVSYESIGVAALDLNEHEAENLQRTPGVQLIVRNEIRSIPPVPEFTAGFYSGVAVGADSDVTWGLRRIGVERTTLGGSGIPIAVLDTGVDLGHPDFQGKIVASRSFVPGESVDDINGHGTHCCGTAAGPRQPLWGPRYGVAPDAPLIVAKVLANNGSGYDRWILAAMQWAADAGARIISMSLGSEREPGVPFNAAYERVAALLRLRGILVVAAAGNESKRPAYLAAIGNPAACPSIVAVAAVDSNDAVARFSCAEMPGDPARLALSAPGVGIHSAWPRSTYKTISGTSMACPHVSGAAALLMQAHPTETPDQIATRIIAAAAPIQAPRSDVGAGVVQLP